MKPALPPTFDPEFYRSSYADVAYWSDDQALEHFQVYGISEGRVGSLGAWRKTIIDSAKQEASVLEIGPFANPAVVGACVKYLDAYDKDELIRRCAWHGLDASRVPHIDYVSPAGSFEMVDSKFSAVISSHSIEHQTDLVRHLQNISSVLEEDGRYYIISPDKRFCFDHYRSASTVSDAIAAYILNIGRHQPRTIVSHLIETTHNDPVRHWASDHGNVAYLGGIDFKVINDQLRKDEYIDSHGWQLTPDSFFEIVSFLNRSGLTDLAPERVYHTPRNMFEFTAVLRKGWQDDTSAFTERHVVDFRGLHRLQQGARHKNQASLDISNCKVEALEAEVEMLEAANKSLLDELQRTKREIEDVHASRSWRMTAPIRYFKRRFLGH